jgi:hypothetical protein
MALCMISIQKLIATAASVRVSDFTSTTETANPTAEEKYCKERRPYRHGEFDGNDLCEWDQAQGYKPAILRGIVNGIAQCVLGQPFGADRSQPACCVDQRPEHGKPQGRAQQHDLEDRELPCGFAPGHGDHHHQCQPAGHPARGASEWGIEAGLHTRKHS